MYRRSGKKPDENSEAPLLASTDESTPEKKRKTDTIIYSDPENAAIVDKKATKTQDDDQRQATPAEFGYRDQARDADYRFALDFQEAEFVANELNITASDTISEENTSGFLLEPESIEIPVSKDQPKKNKIGPHFFDPEFSDSKRIGEQEMKSSPAKRKKEMGSHESSEEDVTQLLQQTTHHVAPSIRRKSIEMEDVDKIMRLRAQLPENRTISETITTMQLNAPEQPGYERKGMPNTASLEAIKVSTPSTTHSIHKHKSESYIPEVSEKQNPYSFASDVLAQYEQVLIEEGYTQVFHTPIPENHPFLSHPQMKPVNDKDEEVNGVATFANAVGHHISGRLSARAFEKDGMIYMLMLRQIFSAMPQEINTETIQKNIKNENIFREFPDGVCISLIVLVRNPKGYIEEQLRLIPNGGGGHPGLVFQNEGPEALCIIAAGEIYILNGEIILINDKSGNFNEKLGPRHLDQKAALDLLLRPYYAEKYKNNCFVAASRDDSVIVYEVLRRGFPHSLIRPYSLAKDFPLESLPEDIKVIAIASEKAYQKRVSQQKENKLATTPKPSHPDDKKTAIIPSTTTTTTTSTSVEINAPEADQADFQKPVDQADQKNENKNKHTDVTATTTFGVFARTNDSAVSVSGKTSRSEQVGDSTHETLTGESSIYNDYVADNTNRSKN